MNSAEPRVEKVPLEAPSVPEPPVDPRRALVQAAFEEGCSMLAETGLLPMWWKKLAPLLIEERDLVRRALADVGRLRPTEEK